MNNLVYPFYKAWKVDGVSPAAGYRLYTYEIGSTTLKTTYSDYLLTTPNSNPIVLNSIGEAVVFLGIGPYKLVLKNEDSTSTLSTFDYVIGEMDNDSGSFLATLVGCTTSPTIMIKWNKVGNIVNLIIPSISGTSNTTGLSLLGLPNTLIPITSQYIQNLDCKDNGTIYPATIGITNGGALTLYRKPTITDAITATFTNSGVKGITNGVSENFSITYSLL